MTLWFVYRISPHGEVQPCCYAQSKESGMDALDDFAINSWMQDAQVDTRPRDCDPEHPLHPDYRPRTEMEAMYSLRVVDSADEDIGFFIEELECGHLRYRWEVRSADLYIGDALADPSDAENMISGTSCVDVGQYPKEDE